MADRHTSLQYLYPAYPERRLVQQPSARLIYNSTSMSLFSLYRGQKYDDWILKAQGERRNKRSSDLFRHAGNDDDDDAVWKTATETRDEILSGKLDVVDNVSLLARRCRRYGLQGPINAVAEEMYDEVSKYNFCD